MHSIFEQRRYLIPFRSTLLPQIFTDVLVVGTGVAGARAAQAAASQGLDVITLSKDSPMQSNTAWAQGGIAAVISDTDSIDAHIQNTIDAGAGLCNHAAVKQIVTRGRKAIEELIELGMRFDRDENGKLQLGREGGHDANRIIHTDGDATGRALAHILTTAIDENPKIRVFDKCFVIDLITQSGPGTRVLGAITHHPKYGLQMIWAKATIIASGGCGMLFRETTNPPSATADGHAIAYRAGVALTDLEFEQFHPTTLYLAGASRALLTEAIRGEGAFLLNRAGERFMLEEHELAELAPRDVVSRAILKQMRKTDETHVNLDCRHIGHFATRFPGITKLLEQFDLDPAINLIPIRPAAHYMIGGLAVDEFTRTNLPGLYACGEAASSGFNGANRLASNSLLEGLVCGQIAGETCIEMMDQEISFPLQIVSEIAPSKRSQLDVGDVDRSFRNVMWRHVSIEREGNHLKEVTEMFNFWGRYTLDKIFESREGWETQNQLLIGALITKAATWRRESRGTHFRNDYPETSPEFACHAHWISGMDEPLIKPLEYATVS